jgi:hypothetical protein
MSSTLATSSLLHVLANQSEPSTAQSLARLLGAERTAVNRLLYQLQGMGQVSLTTDASSKRPLWSAIACSAPSPTPAWFIYRPCVSSWIDVQCAVKMAVHTLSSFS